jgi:very-short-patch-repair endonuclease
MKFRRQYPIGPYIADFCCTKERLIVEVDGGHHDEQLARDEERTAYLEREGYRVLRFWNNEVMSKLEGVFERIVESTSPSPQPSPPVGERGLN